MIARCLLVASALLAAGCERRADATLASPQAPSGSRPSPAASPRTPAASAPSPAASAPAPAPGGDLPPTCRERLAAVKGLAPAALTDPALRAELFGRARGEPVVLDRMPQAAPGTLAEKRRKAKSRAELRALVLAEGYLAATKPDEALALATGLVLRDLFDEPTIVLQRGERTHTLVRREARGGHVYEHEDGTRAELLLFDRVGTEPLGAPLHVDLASAAIREGLPPIAGIALSSTYAVATLEGGARALFAREGAALSLACVDGVVEGREERKARLARVEKIRAAVELQIVEEHPFDRPRDEKTAEKDGHLRPLWNEAYKRGAPVFVGEGGTYPVFDAKGRPAPPEVCVEFIVDTLERAGGSWYRADARERTAGTLDFDALGLSNRRGVLAFEKWASTSGHYDARRYAGDERVPFGERARFFRTLLELRDVAPGDVVAIQGEKRDGLIHQHAILVLRTDPLSGFPFDLADQMKRPRRRTWEGIMAEAPKRSLLYRLRPKDEVLP